MAAGPFRVEIGWAIDFGVLKDALFLRTAQFPTHRLHSWLEKYAGVMICVIRHGSRQSHVNLTQCPVAFWEFAMWFYTECSIPPFES